MRISLNNHDVKNSQPQNNAIDDRYPNLKKTVQGGGTINVPVDGADHIVTIPHNLGYIPMVQAMGYEHNYFFVDYWVRLPMWAYRAGTEIVWKVYADNVNVYLSFFYNDFGVGTPVQHIDYNYRIYIDKGKL